MAMMGVLGPGESLPVTNLRVSVPRVSAKNLICALPGQSHRHMLANLFAKSKQRDIHICHTRQVPGTNRVLQIVNQVLRAKDAPVVVCLQMLLHQPDKIAVRIGLKFIWHKIAVIVHIIYRKSRQGLPFFHGANCGNQAGIQAPGKKGPNRHIGHHLPPNSIGHQKSDRLRSFLKAFPMLPVTKIPISFFCQPALLIITAPAGPKFINVQQNTAARRSARAKQQNLCRALLIQLRLHPRILKNRLYFRSE